MSGIDNLTRTNMSGVDNLTRSVGSGADLLTKSSGTASDNLAKNNFTIINENVTLDDITPTTLDVLNTDDFPVSGNAKVTRLATGVEENVTYTGKTTTTLTGVLCTLTSFAVVVGDKIETR
jgi:hypothetical protein